MNRKQAENILDGYLLIFTNPNMDDAAKALREVILDGMTNYSNFSKTSYPSITWPGTTVPNVTTPTTTKPIVTCDAGGAE